MNKRIGISVNQEDVQHIIDCYEKDMEYIKQLETNWNELKKWLEWHEVTPTTLSTIYAQIEYSFYRGVLNKMKELERGKK